VIAGENMLVTAGGIDGHITIERRVTGIHIQNAILLYGTDARST